MRSIKEELKEMLTSFPVIEVSKHICNGCNEEVTVKDITIFAGPQKGEVVQREVGCKCFEISEARQAYEDHQRFLSGGG